MSFLPVSIIKIGRSFVSEIGRDASARELLQAIVSMARSLGFHICVEGVEEDEQHLILKETKSDYLQGFFYGRPMDMPRFYQSYLSAAAATYRFCAAFSRSFALLQK